MASSSAGGWGTFHPSPPVSTSLPTSPYGSHSSNNRPQKSLSNLSPFAEGFRPSLFTLRNVGEAGITEEAEEDEENRLPDAHEANTAIDRGPSNHAELALELPDDLSPPSPPPKSTKMMSIEELAAGLGISPDPEPCLIDAADDASDKALAVNGRDAVQEKDDHQTRPIQRVAIEGAEGAASLPATSLINTYSPIDQAEEPVSPHQADGAPTLNVHHEPRKSLSAPNLQLFLADAANSGQINFLSRHPVSEQGYVAGQSSESQSGRSTPVSAEYSNPSDEERARQRRILSTSTKGPHKRDNIVRTASHSPVTALRNPESWLDRNDSEAIISNPSDEEEILREHLMHPHPRQTLHWNDLPIPSATAINTAPFFIHASTPSHASSTFPSSVGRDPSSKPGSRLGLNAAAPEFVFGGVARSRISGRHGGSLASSVATDVQQVTDVQQDPSTKSRETPHLNAAAPEFKPNFIFKLPPLPPSTAGQSREPFTSMFSSNAPYVEDYVPEAQPGSAKRQRVEHAHGQHDDSRFEDISSEITPRKIIAPANQFLSQKGPQADANANGKDNMRSFKFPPSPVLAPQASPPSQPSPMTMLARPMGSISSVGHGSATALSSTLQQFRFVSPSSQTRAIIPAHSLEPSPSEQRPPLPSSDETAGASNSQSPGIDYRIGQPSHTVTQTVLSPSSRMSDFGGGGSRMPSSTVVSICCPAMYVREW